MANKILSRREFLGRSISASAGLSIAVSSCAGETKTSNPTCKPNVLVIFSDQQHFEALGFKNPFFDTPNQDAMAKESVVFERSFCT